MGAGSKPLISAKNTAGKIALRDLKYLHQTQSHSRRSTYFGSRRSSGDDPMDGRIDIHEGRSSREKANGNQDGYSYKEWTRVMMDVLY